MINKESTQAGTGVSAPCCPGNGGDCGVTSDTRMTLGELEPNTALIICGHCFRKEREVRMVSFDQEGPSAVCDLDHQTGEAEQDAKLMSLHHLFEWEPEFAFFKDLKEGQTAWKSGPKTWTIEETRPPE